MIFQKTLKSSINCSGVALHSGAKVSMTLKPAAANSGIVFKRTDIVDGNPVIPATWDRVVDTRMCTVLGNEDGVTVGTVEHLLSALSGCRIDNAVIEINGPEVPVMDGSAAPFVFLFDCANIEEQDVPRRAIRIKKEVSIQEGDLTVTLSPSDGMTFDFEIDFDSKAVSRQTISIGLVNGTYKREISRARTFGFLHEVEQLWEAGLAKGGSLENAVVVSGDKVLNEEGLRYDDEFVRHKVLDAIGDLYLAGGAILGAFNGVCSGHAANNRLLRALFADPEAWEYEDLVEVSPETAAAGGITTTRERAAAAPAIA
ncbi:MAG: UDP-3-O-acyl-N-acetylglucosamine deacetylase [Rhodospirillales bacterium]|nr:UDP-3-O-acyl-N-acetylglucosamine deacetylase [Rhodospirillales bacterium]